MSVWAALDLVVRRYAIGEAVAGGQFRWAALLTRRYVDAVGRAR